MVNFVLAHSDGDTDSGDCGKFKGSSYLDDLTWYGWQGNMWSNIAGKENYSNIRSWIVESASRDLMVALTVNASPELLNAPLKTVRSCTG